MVFEKQLFCIYLGVKLCGRFLSKLVAMQNKNNSIKIIKSFIMQTT